MESTSQASLSILLNRDVITSVSRYFRWDELDVCKKICKTWHNAINEPITKLNCARPLPDFLHKKVVKMLNFFNSNGEYSDEVRKTTIDSIIQDSTFELDKFVNMIVTHYKNRIEELSQWGYPLDRALDPKDYKCTIFKLTEDNKIVFRDGPYTCISDKYIIDEDQILTEKTCGKPKKTYYIDLKYSLKEIEEKVIGRFTEEKNIVELKKEEKLKEKEEKLKAEKFKAKEIKKAEKRDERLVSIFKNLIFFTVISGISAISSLTLKGPENLSTICTSAFIGSTCCLIIATYAYQILLPTKTFATG